MPLSLQPTTNGRTSCAIIRRLKAPVIEMINHPQNPYVKLLVVFGRDDKDLLQAAKGIAQGNILFRGESVVVNEVKPLLTA